jgi:hypothetical protein
MTLFKEEDMTGVCDLRRIAASAVAIAFTANAVQAIATYRHYGTPTVDGIEGANEWIGAVAGTANLTLPAGLGGGTSMVVFWVMNDDTYLYVALRFPLGTSPTEPAYIGLGASASAAGLDPCLGQTVGDDFGIYSQENLAIPIDSHYSSDCQSVAPDTDNGGFLDTQGTWAISLSSTFFELQQPLDNGDDANDISLPAPNLMQATFYAGGCDATLVDCGTPAFISRRIFLMTADTIFFDDFESGDMTFWSLASP